MLLHEAPCSLRMVLLQPLPPCRLQDVHSAACRMAAQETACPGPCLVLMLLCSCLPEQKLNFGVMLLRGLFKEWLSAYQDRLRLAEAAGAAEAERAAPPRARSAATIASTSLCALKMSRAGLADADWGCRQI